jgi:hypothetical protein
MLLIIGVVLGAFGIVGAVMTDTKNELANLIQRTEEGNIALVKGDIDTYIELTNHAKDYSLMNPFGGTPTHGFDSSPDHRAEMKKFFKSGTLKQEVVATYQSNDLVVLITIERIRAVIKELPEQDWLLRVTQVFRRNGSD